MKHNLTVMIMNIRQTPKPQYAVILHLSKNRQETQHNNGHGCELKRWIELSSFWALKMRVSAPNAAYL